MSFQWNVQCTVCNHEVENHCTTCNYNLCHQCTKTHTEQNTGHHVESFRETSGSRFFSGNQIICTKHADHKCELFCETCAEPVCSKCIVKFHKHHSFVELASYISRFYSVVSQSIDELETKTIPKLQESLDRTKSARLDFEKSVADLDGQLTTSAETAKTLIDKTLQQRQQKLRDLSKRPTSVLLKQESEIYLFIGSAQNVVKDFRENSLKGDIWRLVEWRDKALACKTTECCCQTFVPPEFLPGHINETHLKSCLGDVREPAPDTTTQKETVPLPDIDHDYLQSLKPFRIDSSPTVTTHILNGKPKFLHLTCTGKQAAYVALDDNKLALIDRDGVTHETIYLRFRLTWWSNCMSSSINGALVINDFNNKQIMQGSTGMESVRISSKQLRKFKDPTYIEQLPNGETIVAFAENKQIARFDASGNLIKAIGKRFIQADIFIRPRFLAVNRVTGNIWVTDSDTEFWISTGKVVVVHPNGKLMFTYTGANIHSEFSPLDLCSDAIGNMLINDSDGFKVHIVSQDGEFLRYLLTMERGLECPWSIDIDLEGYVWIREGFSGKLKIVKHLI